MFVVRPLRPWPRIRQLLALPFALGLPLALLAGAGCQSPEEARQAADAEVYPLVLERRAQLGLEAPPLAIEPSPDSLRARLLRGEAGPQGALSLVQCLEIASENNRDYSGRKERLYNSALDLTLERWRFGWREDLSGSASVLGTGDESTSASASGGYSLTKLFGSGANVVLDIGAGMARSLTFSDDWNPVGDLGLSITQPILRGFGSAIVREPLTQAERNLIYEVRAFERFRRTFAYDTASRYYNLLESYQRLANQEANFKSLETLTKRNEKLAEAGRLSDIELGQARQNELSSRNQLVISRASLQSQLDDFKLFLGLPVEFALVLDPSVLESLETGSAGDVEEPIAVRFALANRLDHATVLQQFEDRRRAVAISADQLRSGLTISGGATLQSAEGQPLNFDLDNADWSATLSWDLPIDILPERNGYRKALINLQSAARSCEQSADSITADIRDELRVTLASREAYEIQRRAVQLAERRIQSTRLKLDAGRSTTRDLLEAENDLLEARNNTTSALINYTLNRYALWRDLEILRVDEQGLRGELQLLAAAPVAAAQGQN
jgi:outer membrane protein TolC